ncbi:MAG: hypothetical protein V3574_03910 [Candidatus Moraniibacteriota bacterium]
MEIFEKQKLKLDIKRKIDDCVRAFPFHFYVNVIINLVLIGIILILLAFVVLMLVNLGFADGLEYLIITILVLGTILKVTGKSFLKNIRVLHQIQDGDYAFGIEDHELDNMIEFVEDLPLAKDEVERMRKTLSFDKIIDVLEAVEIIVLKDGKWDLELGLKYEAEGIMKKYLKQENDAKADLERKESEKEY